MTDNLRERIGITELGALCSWVRSVVGKHYRVKFESGADTAYVDSAGNMVIPHPNAQMTIRDAIRLRGFCLHETSHPMYQPEIFDVMKKYPTKPGSPLGGVYNILLDIHCETMRAKEWPGDAKALSEFGAVVGHDCYDRLSKSIKDNDNVIPPQFKKVATVMIAARNAEATWNIGMLVGFDKLVNEVYTQDMRDTAAELEAKFRLTERLIVNGNDEDEWTIWELSKEIYQYLWGKDPESQINPSGGSGKKGDEKEESTEPKPAAGDPGKSEDGEGEAPAPPEGSGEEDGDEEDDEQAKEKIKITELLFSDHYDTTVGKGSGMGFDYTNTKHYDVYEPVDPARFKVIDYSKGET